MPIFHNRRATNIHSGKNEKNHISQEVQNMSSLDDGDGRFSHLAT